MCLVVVQDGLLAVFYLKKLVFIKNLSNRLDPCPDSLNPDLKHRFLSNPTDSLWAS
jgi:hypothetical protein